MWRLVAGVGLGLVAISARADEHLELRAAQAELRLARRYLQQAGRDYEGHRREALDAVNLALKDIRDALEGAERAESGPHRPPAEP